MTTKRSIFFFWALLLVPTLMMAAVAVRLLAHEQERINRSAISALSQRATAVSETIHLTVETIEENLSRSLLDIDPVQRRNQLLIWEKTNPLIRNIFIYQKSPGLEYPVRGMESTREERRFIARYDSFFSGRIDFNFKGSSPGEYPKTGKFLSFYSGSKYDAPDIKNMAESPRQKLVALSRVAQKEPVSEQPVILDGKPEQPFREKTGWIPWFSENRLYLLGWVQKEKNGPVYGVELELMTLMSRLVLDFPELSQKGAALVLKDGSGNVMHQSGALVIRPDEKPAAVIAISNLLPHWQMNVFIDNKGFGASRGFLYVSLILLCIFIVAIVSGGTLLTRLTLQKMKDARQKTSFVSSVSHELKTPLTSIRMYAELLLSKRIIDKNKIQTYLSVIVSESGRLTRLINNVLDFGKLEQGEKKYQLTCFEMDELLNQILFVHSPRIKNQDIEIITETEKGDYHVKADKDAMQQVILNLLDNALKYAGKGKFVKFILKKKDSFVLLTICDDGPGIPKAQRKAVFEKFYRMDNSLTSQQPGSGLGLSIAQQIIKDLGGALFFESMPENGACFTIRIKYHEAH